MRESIKRIVLSLFPELGGGLHLPKYGKVVSISDPPKRSICGEFRPYYAVDIQPITVTGESLDSGVVTGVPVPIDGAGDNSGCLKLPDVGTRVVYGFINGQATHPFIMQIMPDGLLVPDCDEGEILLQTSENNSFRLDKNGSHISRARSSIQHHTPLLKQVANTSESEFGKQSATINGRSSWLVKGLLSFKSYLAIKILSAKKLVIGSGESLEITAAATMTETIGEDKKVHVEKDLTAVVNGASDSIAKLRQSIKVENGGNVWIGNESVNVLAVLSSTLDVLEQLSMSIANHTHPSVSKPENMAEFISAKSEFSNEKNKVDSLI